MKQMSLPWLVRLCGLVLCVWLGAASPASALVLTNDVPNTAQNTVSAVSEVQTTLTTLDQLQTQIEQLKRQKQNLQKLDIRDMADFIQVTLMVSKLIKSTVAMAGTWFDVANQIDQIWGRFGPTEYRGKPFYERLKKWEEHTDNAIRFSIKTHAVVAQMHGMLHAQLLKLDRKSQTNQVSGTVAAVELQTKTISVVAHQVSLVTELALNALNTWHNDYMEQRRRAKAARARQLDALGRGFGTHETNVPPVVLRDF